MLQNDIKRNPLTRNKWRKKYPFATKRNVRQLTDISIKALLIKD